MVESATQKTIEIFHDDPPKLPQIRLNVTLSELTDYVLISERIEGKHQEKIFGSAAKGFFHFYGAVFTGSLRARQLELNGQKIQLNIPTGLYDGARILLTWKWPVSIYTRDQKGEAILGVVMLDEGRPPQFWLTARVGAGGWEGYNFWGKILSKNSIRLWIRIRGAEVSVDMERKSGT
ncbi:hypothetical protein CDD81_4706 [Ophiocordyceps australis]|uniref:Uncharacterized protein n=1 Tax=Ophiocordyceps australis TaxID=1399860 RepID=A0A2C5XAC7_9HYPO|nr:hypothetical protein CDD81_4706 [Ophiocordyceps australis]